MSKLLLIFTLFTMIVSSTISVLHAHMDIESISSVHVDTESNPKNDNEPVSSNDCGMICCGSCLYHYVTTNSNQDDFMSARDRVIPSNTDYYLLDPTYTRKRPPKS